MHTYLIAAVLFSAIPAVASGTEAIHPVFESAVDLTPQCPIDELVFGRLKELGIRPANLSSDAVFVRRVYLDVIGTLPTADEARAFLADKSPGKRAKLIDQLLERPEFADYWAMKWSDLLRVKAEFPINLWPNAAQAYHRWIHASLRENMPYDRFVRELLTSNGSNFRVPQVNFYRAVQSREPEAIARAVALTLMGARAEKWPEERLNGLSGFFAEINFKETTEWKEEIVSFDPDKPTATEAVFPDGTRAKLPPGEDPRVVFANWLITPENPWFTRNVSNRVWSWLLGRGIIDEPDDIRPDNSPSNPELLAYLQKELVASNYDLKHLYRLILNSKTYQLSSIPRSDKPEAAANFAAYPLRRLDAEVLIDALNQITGTSEEYSSAVPEPFTFIPQDYRSIALPDGSITSPFLEQFGRPSRDTGLESERSNRPTADQRLHMLNSSHIQKKIENSPKLRALFQSAAPRATTKFKKGAKFRKKQAAPTREPKQVLVELYLTILSREPTEDEMKTVAQYFQNTSDKRAGVIDLTWALINSAEFSYRH